MIDRMIEQGLQAVDSHLRRVIASDIDLLEGASQHIVSSGGKRVRPRLAMLAYLAAGGQSLEPVTAMAAAVELVHTATLVHDDINDHSLTRRGKPSVHARWGRTFALLTGDYLFAKVYEMMSPYGAEINQLMSAACVRLVEGETLQAAAAKAGKMDSETYKTIIARKTASLFEVAARMAGILAEAEPDVIEALSEFGYDLGLTFQIVDDILDIIGDPETLGKPVGADVVQGRGLLATENGRQLAGVPNHQAGAPAAVAADDNQVAAMLANLRESGAVDVARLQAQEMARRARATLERVPPSPARDGLAELVDQIISRDS